MFKKLENRYKEVKMLHICLGDRWRIIDVYYVITGKVYE